YGMFGYTMITEFQKSRIIYGLPPAIYIFMIAWLVLGFIGVLSLFGLGNIANFAHLGGLIAGVIMAMVVTIISKDSYLDEKN
ncbi:MAG: rhomboid family intramembrane serine protease, partial [Flammeovirgaceae bacterium]